MKKNQKNSCRTAQTEIIGDSDLIKKLLRDIDKIARADATVLISGDSGTGKELIARAIHQNNPQRAAYPFVVVNCGAIPAELIESELFAILKAHLLAPTSPLLGALHPQMAARFFLMRLPIFPLAIRLSCCAFYRRAVSTQWALVGQDRSMYEWSPPPILNWKRL